MASKQQLPVLLAAVLVTAVVCQEAEDFVCPEDEPTGLFPDYQFCDAYWKCTKGKAEFVTCPSGLMFSEIRAYSQIEPCDLPIKVDCQGLEFYHQREEGPCTYQNGRFPHEDPAVCSSYYVCESGNPTMRDCTGDTIFNPETLVCEWAYQHPERQCNQTTKSLGEFRCKPEVKQYTVNDQLILHPTFPHAQDCRKFYYCLSGVTPREGLCVYGLVYSIEDRQCQDPSTVPGCEEYYLPEEDEEYFEDA